MPYFIKKFNESLNIFFTIVTDNYYETLIF